MKFFDNKEITVKYYGNKAIAYTYLGLQLIWQAIRSCFGSGWWKNKKPWINNNKWKNK